MDAFSEILSSLKLKGALYFNAEFSAPWGVDTPASRELAPALAPGAEHLVIYHFILEGHVYAYMPDGHSLAVEAGELVVVPGGDPHLMTSEPKRATWRESPAVLRKIRTRDLSILREGGGGATTRIVCGYMACDPLLCRPILTGLPSLLKVNIRTDSAGQWLEASILRLVEEAGSGGAGSEAMLAKLSETLFVETLRRFVANLPEQQTGWLAGARDPVVGKTLSLMHARVAHPWTIAGLAREAGLSRSSLVERFTRYLAEPPMSYLKRWRLQLAARALATTPQSVGEIAAEVGYESEAAFNRAFKRAFGVPPARYRREQAAALSRAAADTA